MINEILKNSTRFIFLVLFQILILNNIHLSGFLNPFLYVLFILMLPFQTPKWLGLILAFFIGITIDMFSDTGGLHAAASVFMAFSRPAVLKLVSPRDGYDLNRSLTLKQLGFNWFFSYSAILIIAHHFVLFYLEVFNFSNFFSTLFRVIASSLFSITLVIISQFFSSNSRLK